MRRLIVMSFMGKCFICHDCLAPSSFPPSSHTKPPPPSTPPYLQPDFKERLIGGLLLASLIHVWVLGVIVVPLATYKLLAQVGGIGGGGAGGAGLGGELLCLLSFVRNR